MGYRQSRAPWMRASTRHSASDVFLATDPHSHPLDAALSSCLEPEVVRGLCLVREEPNERMTR